MSLKKVNFPNFLKAFPKVILPVHLDAESHLTFSKENKPLPLQLIHAYISPHEKVEGDEFTEYIPCFQIPPQEHFVGVVYWKAQLLDYHYVLNTYTKEGEFIHSYHIGGTRSDGQNIAQLLSTIQPNLQIHMAAGTTKVGDKEYNPTDTKVFKIELLSNGEANIEMDENIWS